MKYERERIFLFTNNPFILTNEFYIFVYDLRYRNYFAYISCTYAYDKVFFYWIAGINSRSTYILLGQHNIQTHCRLRSYPICNAPKTMRISRDFQTSRNRDGVLKRKITNEVGLLCPQKYSNESYPSFDL